MLGSAQARREAVVVRDHHGRVETLKVHNDHWTSVKPWLGFHDKGDALRGLHSSPLDRTWRYGCEVEGMGDPQHHAFYLR